MVWCTIVVIKKLVMVIKLLFDSCEVGGGGGLKHLRGGVKDEVIMSLYMLWRWWEIGEGTEGHLSLGIF